MLDIYYTNGNSQNFVAKIFYKYYHLDIKQLGISCNENGKPYLKGGGYFYNLAHTGGAAVLAVSDSDIGIDIEKKDRTISKSVTHKYFSADESPLLPIERWTVKEAFIKYKGYSVHRDLKKIKIVGGDIFYSGEKQSGEFKIIYKNDFIIAVYANKLDSLTDIKKESAI